MNLLNEKTSIPVVSVLSQTPDEEVFKKALSHLPDWEYRLNILSRNPPFEFIKYTIREGRHCEALVQYVGIHDKSEVKKLLRITCFSSCVPESLRLADKIGQSFKDFNLTY